MGGASFSPSKASGLIPNENSTVSAALKPQVVFMPFPYYNPIPFPVNRVVTKKVERKLVLGVSPFSGKYGAL